MAKSLNMPKKARTKREATKRKKPQTVDLAKNLLNPIEAKTVGQQIYIDAICENPFVICNGPAGTGKTLISFGLALKYYLTDKNIQRIIISRPTYAASKEPKLGALPGSLEEKMSPFLAPILKDSLPLLINQNSFIARVAGREILDSSTVLSRFNIEVVPLHLMRGRTFHNSFVILDEAQNCNLEDFRLFLTRIGRNSRVVIEGDSSQSDRYDGALESLMTKLMGMNHIGVVHLTNEDILRNPLIGEILDRLND